MKADSSKIIVWLKQLRTFLNQPYPEDKGVKAFFTGCLGISVFIGLFLYIFEPFGMNQAGDAKAYLCFMFGLITFVTSFSFDLLLRYVLRIHRDNETWVFWKWMVTVLIILILIAIGNYLFMWKLSGSALTFTGFSAALISTFLVGIFPVFYIGFLNSRRATLKNQQVAGTIKLHFNGATGAQVQWQTEAQDRLELAADEILFVEAMQNYVVVNYIQGNEVQQKIVRSTLSAVEIKLKESSVQRSHRSFLVNRTKIARVEGNAQGLRLTLDGLDDKHVPVSRRYIPYFQ